MKKREVYCKLVVLIVVAVSILGRVESTNADRQAPRYSFTLAGGGVCREGELLVRFAPRVDSKQRTISECNAVLASIGGGTVKHSYKLVSGLTLVKLPENLSVENALVTFKNVNGILYAEPNYKIYLDSTFPDDTRFDELWGMHNIEQTGGTDDADIDAPEAWDIATDASDVIVAVIDSGVDYTHPDLAANMWVNEAELNGIPDYDDDGNGYKDDIYGYDFGGFTQEDQDSDPNDASGHGTHIAGTIGAEGNNGLGVVGVCWNVKIMALKVFPPGQPDLWEAFVDNALEAIDYAVYNGANVINASWGIDTNYHEGLRDTIENAGDAGVLFVVSAGNDYHSNNDDTPRYPSCYDLDNIISVLATLHTDHKAWYSNYGPTSVDVGAPGGETRHSENEGILSTVPGGGYDFKKGTSMATPHVAGACALVWGMNQELSHIEVRDILLETVDKTLPGLCVSEGRLNLNKALHRTFLYPGAGGGLCIKSDSGKPVARFDNSGNIYLKGTLYEYSYPEASEESEFRFQDMYGTERMIIDADTGDVYLSGYLYEEESSLIPPTYMGNLILKTKYGSIVAYVDYGGNLHLKGKVYEVQ